MIWLVRSGGKVSSLLRLASPLALTVLFFHLFLPLFFLLLVLALYLLAVRLPRCSSITLSASPSRLLLLLMAHTVAVCVLLSGINRACQSCNSSPLPPRPSLTAHRGCSLDYPENSQVAFEHAVRIPSVSTLESDVQISSDGELFLLHDSHLARTTTVATSCPGINPLLTASRLNYHTGDCPLGSLSLRQDHSQHVPLLNHLLEIAALTNLNVVFDLYQPPEGHTHQQGFVNLMVEAIAQSRMRPSKIWLLTYACGTHSKCLDLKTVEGEKGGEGPVISAAFPAFTLAGKTSQMGLDQFEALGITIANEEWSTSLATLRYGEIPFLPPSLNPSLPQFFFHPGCCSPGTFPSTCIRLTPSCCSTTHGVWQCTVSQLTTVG